MSNRGSRPFGAKSSPPERAVPPIRPAMSKLCAPRCTICCDHGRLGDIRQNYPRPDQGGNLPLEKLEGGQARRRLQYTIVGGRFSELAFWRSDESAKS
jgi:hypothetical protein